MRREVAHLLVVGALTFHLIRYLVDMVMVLGQRHLSFHLGGLGHCLLCSHTKFHHQ